MVAYDSVLTNCQYHRRPTNVGITGARAEATCADVRNMPTQPLRVTVGTTSLP